MRTYVLRRVLQTIPLLLGISLRLLELRQVRVANMLPAVILAPLFVGWWG